MRRTRLCSRFFANWIYVALAVLVHVFGTPAAAQEIVFDLNKFGASSDPRDLEIVGDKIFFFADDGLGRAPYILNPQSGAVRRLIPAATKSAAEVVGKASESSTRDGIQGEGYNEIRTFHDLDGIAVFWFEEDVWRSDGTEPGTYKLVSFEYSDYERVVGNGRLYFTGRPAEGGLQIWTTDGTSEGTHRINTTPSLEFYTRSGLAFLRDSLHFTAKSQLASQEVSLWRSGGGVLDAEEIVGSPDVSMMEFPLTVGNRFYFRAYENVRTGAGQEFWASDGTGRGTILVKDIYPGTGSSEPWNLQLFSNQILFQAYEPVHGGEVWISDGTSAGTVVLKDINAGPGNSSAFYFEPLGDKTYFGARDETRGYELWVTDGTEEGTTLVRDINPGAASSTVKSTRRHNGRVYFAADDGTNGRELWVTDGTSEGTQPAIDLGGALPSEPSDLISTGDALYYAARTFETGRELWVTDGTQIGTRLAADIADLGTESSNVEDTQVLADGQVIAAGTDGLARSALWKLPDEPEGEATMLTTLDGLYVYSSTTSGGISLFSTLGNLYRTDGTAAGTYELPAPGITRLIELGDRLFGIAHDGVVETDGSVIGTSEVFSSKGRLLKLMQASDDLLYVARGSHVDSEIWAIDQDGSPNFVLATDAFNSIAGIHVDSNGRLFFADESGIHVTNADGYHQTLSTLRFDSLRANEGVVLNGILYFGITGPHDAAPVSGPGLWRSDGTPEGTYQLPLETNRARDIRRVGGYILFVESGSPVGAIWSYDSSTHEATKLPVERGSSKVFAEYNDHVLFTADDGIHGLELWQTDGTIEGTSLVADIYPGPASSDPSDFSAGHDGFYVSATTPEYGRELVYISATDVGTVPSATVHNDMAVSVFPNPIGEESRILVEAAQTQRIRVELFDVLGRRIHHLYSGPGPRVGGLPIRISSDDLTSGVYFVRVTSSSGDNAATSFIVAR